MSKRQRSAAQTQGDKLKRNYALKKYRHQNNVPFRLWIIKHQSIFPNFLFELAKTHPTWQLSSPSNFRVES